MSFGKFIVIPIFIAFQAFVMMLVFPKVTINPEILGGGGLLAWVAFQAWAMYFLAGCNPKMGAKTFVGYLGGVIASIAIFEIGDLLSGPNGDLLGFYWGYAIAVFLIVVPVISAQRVPGIDFVPSYFLGAGVFFGLMTHCGVGHTAGEYATVTLAEMIACTLGLAWGYVTVVFQTWYTEKMTGGEAAGADAEKKSEEATA
ncbi:MAG: DUF1097 domain-containing protein [Planctomycetota bacterium]|jgi:hypothetical protein